MDFFVGLKNLGVMNFGAANSTCQNYSSCSDLKGTLPSSDQLRTMHENKSSLESLLTSNGGEKFLVDGYYWSSTDDGINANYLVNVTSGNMRHYYANNTKGDVRAITTCGLEPETPQNGPVGNLCYCDGKVVGVKADGMDFFVGMKDLGTMTWKNANSSSQNYNFCNNINGMLPNRDQLSQINENNMAVNVSLSAQGGSSLKNGYYWSSTKYGSGYYAINLLSSGYVVGSTGSGDVYSVRPVTTCQEPPEDGPFGDLYYCNGKVVGVKTGDMDFYVAMKDLGTMDWSNASYSCQTYSFCGNLKGAIPGYDHLEVMYKNKSSLNSLLSINGGSKLAESSYWSSMNDSYGDGNYDYYFLNMSDGRGGSVWNGRMNYYARPVLLSW